MLRLIPRRGTFGAVAILATALGMGGCGLDLFATDDGPSCTPGIEVVPAPTGGELVLPDNAAHELTATVELCGGDVLDYAFNWFYDADANLQLGETELQRPVSQSPEWRLFACASDRGTHRVRVAAEPITGGESYSIDFDVRIVAGEQAARPSCVAPAISTVQNIQRVDRNNTAELDQVLACLEPYLDENLCDVQASYAAGLAQFGAFNAKTPARWDRRNDMSVAEFRAIFDDEITPMLKRFELVAEKGEDNFSFVVFEPFLVVAFEDLTDLEGDEELNIVLQGEHDMGDVRAIAGFSSVIRGFFEMMLAYNGFVRWILDFPDPSDLNTYSVISLLLERTVEDPEFLTLVEDETPTGRERLLRARGAFMEWFTRLQDAVDFVRNETDPQHDDLFRYWDCGDDGLCDCNLQEDGVFVNNVLACPNNQADYDEAGPDDNEGNGRYDNNEPVGTDHIGFPDFATIDLPSNLDEFYRQTTLIRENIRGPDALDLDELSGQPATLALQSFLIPVPEIRLSEWFLTPAQPRELFALFEADTLQPIFDIESEFYLDDGYDGKENPDETIVHWPNPRELTLGTEFDPVENPDPHFDDFDPFCNPICNWNDGVDNDGDGLVDGLDRLVSGGFDFDTDGGLENNLVFDWVDLDEDFDHDPDEPSEVFDDTGVRDHRGNLVGAGNDRWDFADQPHTFPQGDNILPFGDLDVVDPPNGIANDAVQRRSLYTDDPAKSASLGYNGLYDSFYFFFPDPEFSDVLTFPEDIQSINGEPLTANAKLHRFLSKILELAGTFPIGAVRVGDDKEMPVRAAYGHPCSDEDACRAAVDLVQSD